jgi:DNA invertase Pin-like site-specific DNA recombinase
MKRPGIQEALRLLRRGDAETLVVARIDRLTRSMADFTPLLAQAAKEGWALVALDINVDTTSPAGEAVANVVAAFAQLERRLIGERTKQALAAKRKAGKKLGRPSSLGEDVRARVVDMRASGMTLRQIANALTEQRVRTAAGGRWHASTVAQILASVRRSEPVPAVHDP